VEKLTGGDDKSGVVAASASLGSDHRLTGFGRHENDSLVVAVEGPRRRVSDRLRTGWLPGGGDGEGRRKDGGEEKVAIANGRVSR